MKDKIFIDTNIFIYYISDDKVKKSIAKKIIIDDFDEFIMFISSQVISEFVYVSIRKNLLEKKGTFSLAKEFMDIFVFAMIKKSTILKAFEVMSKYNFSYWDSLIVASALENDCSILYSEDLQHRQIIENKLKILNPFNLS
jgi:predicted nucleic acid-binding protein